VARACDVIYTAVGDDPDASLRASVPPVVYEALRIADTPTKLSNIVARYEHLIVRERDPGRAGGPDEGYLDCDEAAVLLGWALESHRIPYEGVVGESDEGSSHAWVRVNGRNYDPTHQGFGRGYYYVCDRYDPATGVVKVPSRTEGNNPGFEPTY
jgi:hypothetical protein